MLLAADVAPIDALCAALQTKGIRPIPIFVSSLKDPESITFVEAAIGDRKPSAIITATAFATGAEPGVETLFDRAGVPVFQVIIATTRREAWAINPRGLAPADLAMHVVMPELDGRILAGALSFKAEGLADPALGFTALANTPEQDRVDQVAGRIAAHSAAHADAALSASLGDPHPGLPVGTRPHGICRRPRRTRERARDAARLEVAGYTVDSIPESPKACWTRLSAMAMGWGWRVSQLAVDLPAKLWQWSMRRGVRQAPTYPPP